MGATISLTVCTPFPGTPIWENPEKFGLEIIDFDFDHYTTHCPVLNKRIQRRILTMR